MPVATHVLWRINNEYRRRLSQAQTLLNLLEQILVMQHDENQEHALAVLAYAREQVEAMTEEHRHWRYNFYYESPESKRMVQDDAAVNRALARFSRMRTHQENRLQDLYALIYGVPRPDSTRTRVPNGDLWTLTQDAVAELVTFDSFMNDIGQVSQ